MISLNEFHQDFLQSILSDAESRGLMKPQAFFENVCEELVSSGELSNNYTAAEYIKTGMEVYGYDFDQERKILSLLVHQFFQEDEIETLTKSHIYSKFNRLKSFYKKCTLGLYKDLEETSEAFSMAYNIFRYRQENKFDKIRLIILTDGKSTRTLSNIPSELIDDIVTEFRVIDIEYIYKIFLSEYNDSDSELEIKIPCLEISTLTDEYKSYLTVLNGNYIVDIYEKFGQKLFEQNVRTFLQFKGSVNKGIRNTIEYKPELFFAYNNGITATATDIEMDNFGNISKIVNFQIVNGGQTTSAIYAAKKVSKLDVSNVNVQMKLSVVKDKEKQNDFVSKVSEYANTQNKVNKSDFFSNSPFHKEIKNYSKRIWVAAVSGSQRRTHWFYERVRGEYLNEQAYLTNAQKKQFQLENPKEQLIDKTFLSKSENVWLQKPDIVSRGAQYSFSTFAEYITNLLEKDNLAITESYFKDAISRVIMFRSVEKLVSKSSWYDGGYRAQIVAYTIAYLSYLVEKTGKHLNFNLIWEEQKLPDALIDILKVISKSVYDGIINTPEGSANVSEWCKNSRCWELIKQMKVNITLDNRLLIDKEDLKYSKREDKKEKKLENSIEMQILTITTPSEVWNAMYDHYKKYEFVSSITRTQLDILEKMAKKSLNPPSEKQSKILYQLYQQADTDGVI
ncbi:AIPR family protein [Serpentinicella alkaliphila]|uniref:AIPR protein n=1 Tax=Serpentinicella alkaliphila TaxID=1734049 RepID=A0A4R2TS15_9FIRM|nr:AIPR family protein [Serpentinicella alkaliphila]QUH26420.1 AIPR family protein [Serpentinicella alkaliphila]TCP97842.1 AIPR protein [Serpentinicella alkaliphila]